MAIVIAIDAGTTGVRALGVDEAGAIRGWSYREITQHFPRPGWVEHDPVEIWDAVRSTVGELYAELGEPTVAALGITNQRETLLAWSRRTGQPLHRAIVWQDRRTAPDCERLTEAGHLPLVRERTGLVLDPYFSGTKAAWLLREGGVEAGPDLAFGTVDSWLLWNLTGGVHATDPSNASRTMVYDIHARRWDEELAGILGVPLAALPEVRPTSGRLGVTVDGVGVPAGIPVSSLAGDQQSALFGQACFEPGMTKNTYGTGSFVLTNVGATPPPVADGMLTSVAWELATGDVAYALEGAIFVTGAAIQWLRDGLGLLSTASDIGPLAATVNDTNGVFLVPAFTGLGTPWWDPYARGSLFGISRGVTRAHLARAVLESIAYQVRDAVEAMSAAGQQPVTELRADGGASVVDLLLQLQADQLRLPVSRPLQQETTALGAAYLAGLAEGVWSSLEEVGALWQLEARFEPQVDQELADLLHSEWRRAVERSQHWASPGAG